MSRATRIVAVAAAPALIAAVLAAGGGATPQGPSFTNVASFDAAGCVVDATASWSGLTGGPGVSVVWFTLHYTRADGTTYESPGATASQPKPTHSGSLSIGIGGGQASFAQTGTAYVDAAFYRDQKAAGAGGGETGYLALVRSNTVTIDQTC